MFRVKPDPSRVLPIRVYWVTGLCMIIRSMYSYTFCLYTAERLRTLSKHYHISSALGSRHRGWRQPLCSDPIVRTATQSNCFAAAKRKLSCTRYYSSSTTVPGTAVQQSAALSLKWTLHDFGVCGVDSPNILSSVKPNLTSFRILGHLGVFAPSSKVLQQAHRRSSQKRHIDCSLQEHNEKG